MAMRTSSSFQVLKPRNTVVFVGAVALTLGVMTANAHLLALGTMCFVAMLGALGQAWGLLRRVRVRRLHQDRAFQGQGVDVRLQLAGADGKAPELVLVEDSFPPSSTSRISRLVEHPLERSRLVEINFHGRCEHRRGMYVLGPVHLQAYDTLGFFPRELVLDLFTELLVYPQAVDLSQAVLLGEGTLPHVGLEMTRRPGLSEEFLGVREYRNGDPPRIVHWKSSAHNGRLIVKEFQEEITTQVGFFLDLGRMGLVGIGDQTSVEYGIKCCASLAKRAMELGHQMQFFGIGEKVDHIPPGSGVAHLLTILDRLAFAKPQGDSGFAAVVGDFSRMLRRGSTAVLIVGATTVDLDTFIPPLSLMLDRHVLPIVVLIDDRAFIKIYREQEDRHHSALPLDDVAQRLTLLGARVHVIRRAKSMEQALMQGLEQETFL